jgi:hypothetical protein
MDDWPVAPAKGFDGKGAHSIEKEHIQCLSRVAINYATKIFLTEIYSPFGAPSQDLKIRRSSMSGNKAGAATTKYLNGHQ